MLDSHCHIDMYPEPLSVAIEAADRGIFVLAVTNLPSHFEKGFPYVRGMKRIRLALGLHPLASKHHASELALFEKLLPITSFVGEVGLDFSKEGNSTKSRQLETFSRVVDLVSRFPKVLSLHSRGAEREVLEILQNYGVKGAIFHWYTGTIGTLETALSEGHYFSVNPSMTVSSSGKRVIAAIPMDRVLTESDGPYAKVNGRSAKPLDVAIVEKYLGVYWNKPVAEVEAMVWNNFKRVIERVR